MQKISPERAIFVPWLLFTGVAVFLFHNSKLLYMIKTEKISPIAFAAAIMLFILCQCKDGSEHYITLTGNAQGSTYKIVTLLPDGIGEDSLAAMVTDLLGEMDRTFSLHYDKSIISAINRNEDARLNTHFKEVFLISQEVSYNSGGLFDITVAPLVRAMGFGPGSFREIDTTAVDSLLKFVGYEKVALVEGRIVKSDSRVELDMNSVAKGYSVDVVSELFDSLGIESYLIEIGGEVRTTGSYIDRPWRVGIDAPRDGNIVPGQELLAVVEMYDDALATSGNYRNYFVIDGVRYSHTIDPVSGMPAHNRLLSATIVTGDCARADAWATACMVAGPESAKELILENGLEAVLVYSGRDDDVEVWISDGIRERVRLISD